MFDSLSWVMLITVSFVAFIIMRFSSFYMKSDIDRHRFISQVIYLLISVIILILSSNLMTAFISWQLIGVALYTLLNHFHYRKPANRAAKKKFMINRFGDACFLLAILLTLTYYHTTQFSSLFEIKDFNPWILGLIIIAIMTKSAQFPFHVWLIDTMEAPTPVSALMHAGVINSGGFLLARLSPLYIKHDVILLLLVAIGITTAILGQVFARYQYDVKRQLAYSTMAQMGFMILQCGLGCFASAVFHLIMHGFFKAHLFLNSGNQLKKASFDNKRLINKKAVINWVTSFFISVFVFLSGLIILSITTSNSINYILLAFIYITLLSLTYNITVDVSKPKKYKVALMLAVTGVYYIYLFSYILISTSLTYSVFEHSPNLFSKNVIFPAFIIILISMLIIFISANDKTKLNIRFKKLNIEAIARKYFLNKIRLLGEYLILAHQSIARIMKYELLTHIVVVSLYIILNIAFYKISLVAFLIFNLLTITGIILVGNRASSLLNTQKILGLFVINFFIFVYFGINVTNKSMIWFYLVNELLISLALFALINNQNKVTLQKSKQLYFLRNNKLPIAAFYICVLLFLMIGVPGSSSFVYDFYLFNQIISSHIVIGILMLIPFGLLSLVSLHTMQIYCFKKEAALHYSKKINWPLHLLVLLVILINVFNGIFPQYVLKLI